MARKTRDKVIRVPYALAVHGTAERSAVLKVLDDHRTILGPRTDGFEKKVARLFGKRHGVMVNSGSSANLIALHALDLPPGTEVITPALTFSTTVAPLLQRRLVPAFVDSVIGTYQIDVDAIAECVSEKTRALMIPNLLGNLPDLQRLRAIADEHDYQIWIERVDTTGKVGFVLEDGAIKTKGADPDAKLL